MTSVGRPSPVRVLVEATSSRAFASALDWPGWSRSGRTPEAAMEALRAYAGRYAAVLRAAGLDASAVDAGGDPRAGGASRVSAAVELDVVETLAGDASTAFGVPSRIGEADRVPTSGQEAARLAAIVAAAWVEFDRVAAAAPEALRKGPRGGGRDRSRIVAHVRDADLGYAGQLGLRLQLPPEPRAADVAACRSAMLEVLGRASDGSPIARRWTARYAARRIAWHALDHAWEIEDRSG